MAPRTPLLLIGGIIVLCCLTAIANAEEYMLYKDPKQPLAGRIIDLMKRMTLEEKIGQMTQIERTVAKHDVMIKYFIGSVLSGGGSVPAKHAPPEKWVDMFMGTTTPIRLQFFPTTLALVPQGKDPELVKKIGAATALEVRATGIPYAFAPCIAACRDPRWGRCFESYSEDQSIIKSMTELIPGLQGDRPANVQKGVPYVAGQQYVAACAKHYVGDGGTVNGINENNTIATWGQLLRLHMPAYYDSVIKGVSTIMISYSSWNGKKMHVNRDLITGFLKKTQRFRGFVISDWQAIDRITSPEHANYTYSIETSINAGLDMIMVPYNYTEFIDGLTFLVKNNFIPMSRIDDAVKRILRVKFAMGLFEHPLADYSMAKYLGHPAHREIAREAVRKSLVLLKNGKSADQPLLPLPKKAKKILVAGTHANDIGNQCGGWTIEWHGKSGDITPGTTILSAIKNTVDPNTQVHYTKNPDPNHVKTSNYSYAIVVVGEVPYSETYGDSLNLTLPHPGPSIIKNVCASTKCVVVLVTGRPVVFEPYLAQVDALVAAWLPGSEGQGVADVLFGDYGFTGKLPSHGSKMLSNSQ
ncbi:UNVERIFIED_CONTAM: Beta-glucosidase BoGH3B [Sesamum calycinum]|uniref:Beta-glucosidase BoGH3B n=1 Tax=Sesamum calycinum TaxID=2727403 RepID=A0AAW2N2A6_9LAMI